MVELVILGEPMGKQRPKFSFKNGRAYTPNKTTSYENLVRHEYMSKYEEMTFNDNDYIHAEITAYFTMPKGDFGKKGLSKSGREKEAHNWSCNTKADLDNIAKICLDSLNGVAYPDDRQVTELDVHKKWSKEPKVVIKLWCDYEG